MRPLVAIELTRRFGEKNPGSQTTTDPMQGSSMIILPETPLHA